MNTPLFPGSSVESDRILYTPSGFARTSLIHLQEAGVLQAIQPHISRREHLTSYLFFLVLGGSGELRYNKQKYELAAGDCVFLDCRQSYSHATAENLWQLKWVHFYGPNMNSIYEKYLSRGGRPCFHPENPANFEDILNQILIIAASDDHIRDMRLFEKLTSLLTLLMEESWQPSAGRYSASKKQNLRNLKEYLEQHYQERILLDDLAEKFFINKYYLTRIFKEQFGVSINTYLLQVRITHAKQLLRFTDKSIEEIGIECGIGDGNYFSRMFKKVEGVPPGEFRKLWVL